MCGTSSTFAHISDNVIICDTECYVDYWLCKFSNGAEYQLFDGNPLDITGLKLELSHNSIVTFNGIAYDFPMIEAALDGYDNKSLKALSDRLIMTDERVYAKSLNWIDHIDLFNVVPGDGSLKAYGAKMHTHKLQDLPLHPDSTIDWPQRIELREYCGNDVVVTGELYERFRTQINLRIDIGEEYGIDVRSKSDAQIAEAVMKKTLSFKVVKPEYKPGETFYYRPPEWLKFINLDLIERISMLPFSITESGGVTPHFNADFIDWGDTQQRVDINRKFVKRPKDWKYTPLKIRNSSYTIGVGGLHSNEEKTLHRTDENCVLRDHDVASYYPSLILRTGIYPKQIGPIFTKIYTEWYDKRLKAKRKGDKKTANTLKTLLNGTFGKLGSRFSIFYAPSEMLQVTLTGQLAILMLIELMEYSNISVISANTDGIVLKCPRNLEWLADEVIKYWESITGFETERTDYTLLASRDVNSYCAIKPDGEVKLKGALAPSEPGASGWPNPTGQICVTAAIEYLKNGTSVEKTIKECKDIREFIYARAVRGGGILNKRPMFPKIVTKQRKMALLEEYGFADYDELRAWGNADTEYLGKVVRWYYCTESCAWIQYKTSGNQVPRSQGCKPIMELPNQLPDDIDYNWYIKETNDLLTDIGVK